MILSFVVPVYNVRDFLKECLQSLINQDWNHKLYEIIVINDGSTDDSLQIAQEIAHQNTNIKIISQANKGLSMTRNRGIEEATGKYIWFIDSDDWIAKNCLQNIFQKIEENNFPDMVAVSRLKYLPNEKSMKYIENSADGISGKEFLYKRVYQATAPCYLYKREFLLLHNLRFKSGIYHEDAEFTPRALFYADKMVFVPEIIYFHRHRDSSITTSANYKRCDDLVTVAESLRQFKLAESKSEKDNDIFDLIIAYTLIYLFSVLYEFDDDKKSVEFISQLRQKSELLISLLRSKKKNFIAGYHILKRSPKLFWKIYSAMEKRRLK